ncbi:MAG: hypothetical protein RLZZ26_391 [Candidatus Parcubacteria bacterium]|jgi:hypothetical protein
MEKDEKRQKPSPAGAIAGVLYGPIDASEDDYFTYRFLFQNMEIRSFLVPKEKRLEFDKDYDAFYQNLIEARLARKYALRELARHREEIATGKDGIVSGHQHESGDFAPVNLKPFETAYKVLTEKLKPMVYGLGFLRN